MITGRKITKRPPGMVIPTEVNSEESDRLPHRQDSGIIDVFVVFPYLTEATEL